MTNKTWYLENVRDIAKESPYTFYVPSDELIKMLSVGELVKLMFVNNARTDTDTMQAERMWVEIIQIDNDNFVGKLDNQPYEIQGLNAGNEVHFKDYHIMNVYNDELNDPVPSLANQYWDKCITTLAILNDNAPISYICRTEPYNDEDSGWQILSGNETQEYLDNAENSRIVALGVLLNVDDSFIHLLSSDIGTAFEKNKQGKWVETKFEDE